MSLIRTNAMLSNYDVKELIRNGFILKLIKMGEGGWDFYNVYLV